MCECERYKYYVNVSVCCSNISVCKCAEKLKDEAQRRIRLVAEEIISNLLFSSGIILAIKVSIYIFDQWKWFIPFCSDDFPGQYKRLCKRSLPLFFIHSSSRTDQLWRWERIQFFGPLFSLEDLSFIIYSFHLDQMVLEASSWMFYSYSNIRSCLSSLCTTHSTEFFFSSCH